MLWGVRPVRSGNSPGRPRSTNTGFTWCAVLRLSRAGNALTRLSRPCPPSRSRKPYSSGEIARPESYHEARIFFDLALDPDIDPRSAAFSPPGTHRLPADVRYRYQPSTLVRPYLAGTCRRYVPLLPCGWYPRPSPRAPRPSPKPRGTQPPLGPSTLRRESPSERPCTPHPPFAWPIIGGYTFSRFLSILNKNFCLDCTQRSTDRVRLSSAWVRDAFL